MGGRLIQFTSNASWHTNNQQSEIDISKTERNENLVEAITPESREAAPASQPASSVSEPSPAVSVVYIISWNVPRPFNRPGHSYIIFPDFFPSVWLAFGAVLADERQQQRSSSSINGGGGSNSNNYSNYIAWGHPKQQQTAAIASVVEAAAGTGRKEGGSARDREIHRSLTWSSYKINI